MKSRTALRVTVFSLLALGASAAYADSVPVASENSLAGTASLNATAAIATSHLTATSSVDTQVGNTINGIVLAPGANMGLDDILSFQLIGGGGNSLMIGTAVPLPDSFVLLLSGLGMFGVLVLGNRRFRGAMAPRASFGDAIA
jgi:hypothetical protein